MMHWYIDVIKKYAVFDGRAQRQEFWMFFLINLIISTVINVIDLNLLGTNGIIGLVYTLAVLLPSIALSIRRLHDTGRNGWWLLVLFVPFIGAIVFLVFACQDSEPNENDYGLNPKADVVLNPASAET